MADVADPWRRFGEIWSLTMEPCCVPTICEYTIRRNSGIGCPLLQRRCWEKAIVRWDSGDRPNPFGLPPINDASSQSHDKRKARETTWRTMSNNLIQEAVLLEKCIMTISAASPANPNGALMISWNGYKTTADFANSRKWLETVTHPHIEGSMWALFMAGFHAAQQQAAAIASDEATSVDDGEIYIAGKIRDRIVSMNNPKADD